MLNADGTVLSSQDADGICTTFEYSDASGYIGAPTRTRRSNTSCGVTPIDINSGEVEIRTYDHGEAERPLTIERRTNGVIQFTYQGFTYDRDRRLTGAATLDSGTPFTLGYTDVLPSSTVAPGAPAAGSWRTDTTTDLLARPASLSRFIDATNKQTSTFNYASPMSARPTQLVRGFNGSPTSVTNFVYDDFGRLVEATVPEAGAPGAAKATRYEYDIADRMIKKRVGVNSTAVRTSVYTYDSLGRTLNVDHDTENPVICATAPSGTPIQDEEYVYDTCPTTDKPAGITCANGLGRLVIARTIVQCSSGQTIKRGRWYTYDSIGRVSSVAYATVTGTTIGAPATSALAYTPASRLSSWSSPLSTVYDTTFTYGAADGRPTTLTTARGNATIASNLTYRAFGPATGLDTPSVQPVTGGTRTLKMRTSYRSDDSIDTINWTQFRTTGPLTILDINLVKPSLGRGPAGLISSRTDAADIISSRFYGYDALLRLTCEARGAGTTQPSSGDCVSSSSRLAGLYTFGNGQSATSPPDVRLTSFIKSAGKTYTSPAGGESYTYLAGSGQTQGITRTGSNITLAYDLLGRRTSDLDTADITKSRRNYTYLPNGQLGTVSGQNSGGVPYTIAMRYDTEGRPLTIATNTDSYELFWDDGSRLIAASINNGAVRWHYHYLGASLVAATREVSGAVKRFWALTDERGLIYRMVDEVGATFWQARWDATGWRSLVGTPQPNMWVPFALPGQIILDGTAAFSGTSTTTVRPEIALNQWRAYDPMMGAFLQPDPADIGGRSEPEGYSFARAQVPATYDRSGRATFEDCDEERESAINAAIADIASQIDLCTTGECGLSGAATLRRRWKSALLTTKFRCLPHDFWITSIFANASKGWFVRPIDGAMFPLGQPKNTNAYGAVTYIDRQVTLVTKLDRPWACANQLIAHEVLHTGNAITPSWAFYMNASPMPFAKFPSITDVNENPDLVAPGAGQLQKVLNGEDQDEAQVKETVRCIKCPK